MNANCHDAAWRRPSPVPRGKISRTAVASAVALALSVAAGPLTAQEETPSLEEMWRIIQQQQAEIEALKAQNAQLRGEAAPAAPATEPVVAQQAAAPVPVDDGPKSSMDIYGHAMLDMGYRTGQQDPDWFDVVRPTKLPSYEGEFGDDGEFFASVRQSRLGVKSLTPTRFGDLKTTFEFELFGVGADAGQTTFRLRHAWGELGKFGAGQTWSAFMDIDVFPNSIEYWGPNAMVFYRNIQARYTPWSDGDSRFAITLEKPGGVVVSGGPLLVVAPVAG